MLGANANIESPESCGNCKKYALNGGKCLGVRSRHCEKYKPEEGRQKKTAL